MDMDFVKRDPLAKFALEVDDGSFTWNGENAAATLKR